MKVYLFIHVICQVKGDTLLSRPVRSVLFAHIKKYGEANGIKLLAVNGVEDHVHGLLQLHPAQNLAQVVKSIRTNTADWINEGKFLQGVFEWQDDYLALSVSPSSVKQVIDYIDKQEEHHKTKTLESELEVFRNIQF
jgi:REP element-mobilizing transposase RayT